MYKAYIAAMKVAQAGLNAELDEINARIVALKTRHDEFRAFEKDCYEQKLAYEKQCYDEKIKTIDSLFAALIDAEMARRASVAKDVMELAGNRFDGNGSDG